MSRFWSPIVKKLEPYVPGEQPKLQNLTKLNTNENPYPAAPEVAQALGSINVADLRRYPPPFADDFRDVAARLHALL